MHLIIKATREMKMKDKKMYDRTTRRIWLHFNQIKTLT